MMALSLLFIVPALILVVLAVFLLLECCSALLPNRRRQTIGYRTAVDILIPAHNESAIIGETLLALNSECRPRDRVWVVADNCTDATAEVARSHGAQVIERHDLTLRGKGFGLQYAIGQLKSDPRTIFVFLDADCRFAKGALDRLVRAAEDSGRPVQSLYRMTTTDQEQAGVLSRFAVCLKNHVRPRGLSRLRLPCLLTGSGMAIPWSVLQRVNLANDNTADDMQLSCDVTLAGFPPQFCEEAAVAAALPVESNAVQTQRKHWIHGHLLTAARYVPRLLCDGLLHLSPASMALALEVAILPLSLFVALLVALGSASTLIALFSGIWLPALLCAVGFAMVVASLGIAWIGPAREEMKATSLAGLPGHAFRSVRSSLELLIRRQHWVATPRGVVDPQPESAIR